MTPDRRRRKWRDLAARADASRVAGPMSDEDAHPGKERSILGTAALATWLHGITRRERGKDVPTVVASGPKTEEVALRAEALAQMNREDDEAVSELRRLAGRTGRLRRAGKMFAERAQRRGHQHRVAEVLELQGEDFFKPRAHDADCSS